MTHTLTLRPGWSPLTIVLMVIGFMIAWPLGLIVLAYILWGDRIPEFKANARSFSRSSGNAWSHGCYGPRGMNRHESGNAAFDDYRARELRRLEEERRRLDQERRDFETYVQNLRRAKDQEEFDRFMADRNAGRNTGPEGSPT
ncbi:MAG: DUF2852 domain-containing protein [Bauldia sp.]